MLLIVEERARGKRPPAGSGGKAGGGRREGDEVRLPFEGWVAPPYTINPID
jgi:hypothetical protein